MYFTVSDMPSNVFEKILTIVRLIVAILEMAVRAFTGLDVDEHDPGSADN